jgi:hypothetical protein
MQRNEVEALDPNLPHWAVAVEAPMQNWIAAPGCRARARFLVDASTKGPSLTHFGHFNSRASCLVWIMSNQIELRSRMPGAKVHPVQLASWLLGLE